MPLGSYRVISRNKYIAPPPSVRVIAKEIAPENIKSGIPEPPTVGSYGHAPQTVIFRNGVFITKSSNNTFATTEKDFYRNGIVTQVDDYRFGSWIKAGTENYPNREWNKPIPKMPNVAYVTGITPLGLFLPDKYDTQVDLKVTPTIIDAVDPNKKGYFESKSANQYQLLRSSIFDKANRLSKEETEWIEFFAKKGYSIDSSKNSEIFALGIETDSTKQGYLAFYYPGLGILGTEEHFHDNVKQLSERYGLTENESVEAMKRAIIFHEIAHRLGVEGDNAGEHLQGKLQKEFYTMLADRYKNDPKKARIYKALARKGEDYSKGYQKSLATIITQAFDIKGKRKSRVDFLKAKFAAEADALELPYHLREVYINGRLKETVGPLYEDLPTNEYSEDTLEALVAKEMTEARDGKSPRTEYNKSVERVLAKAKKARVYRENKEDYNEGTSDGKAYEGRTVSKYRSMSDARKAAREEAKSEQREAQKEGAEKAEPEAKEAESPSE